LLVGLLGVFFLFICEGYEMQKLLFFLVVCTPPTIPGATQQSEGMHRAGVFWKRGPTYAEVTEEQVSQLKRDTNAFVLKEVSKEEYEAQKPAENPLSGASPEQLMAVLQDAEKAFKHLQKEYEQSREENKELRDRLAVIEAKLTGL
jgi:hypothetical protein